MVELQGQTQLSETIDRCFISTSWHTTFPLTSCFFLPRITSDRTPLKIELIHQLDQAEGVNKPFNFENLWYSYLDLDITVNDSWNKNVIATDPVATIVLKLRRLEEDLGRWKRETGGDIFL